MEAPRKIVYFVRHGQSVDNASPVFQSVDSPLSEKGKRQAEAIAGRLSHISFDTLIASPVRRASETAQLIAGETHKDIVHSDLFVERVKPSEIDGKPWADGRAKDIWRAWEQALCTPGARVSDGENYDDILARADEALAFLLGRPESTLVVVTHGYFLRAVVARVLLGDDSTGAGMKRFQERASVENSAITVLKYADAFEEGAAWRLWTLNDHSHFAE